MPAPQGHSVMRNLLRRPLLAGALAIGLVACGSSTDESAATLQDEEALAKQAAAEVFGSDAAVDVPVISARTYTTGHMQIDVTGFFEIHASPELNRPASFSDGEYTWITFGASGEEAPNASATIGNGDVGISVAVGKYVATGGGADCAITTDVTPTTVSGRYSCPDIVGYNQADGSMGKVKIEVDFAVSS